MTPYCNIEKQVVTVEQNDKIDAVIHLPGESIAEGRWNKNKKERILKSRINGTKLLSEYFSELDHKPKVFISCSAIGYYSHLGEETLTENKEFSEPIFIDDL